MENFEVNQKKFKRMQERSAICKEDLRAVESELNVVEMHRKWAKKMLTYLFWSADDGDFNESLERYKEIYYDEFQNLIAREGELKHERQELSKKLQEIYNEYDPE